MKDKKIDVEEIQLNQNQEDTKDSKNKINVEKIASK